MSRDLKPIEVYNADKTITEVFHQKSMRDLTITQLDGKEIKLVNDEAKKYFPELAFLVEGFSDIYEKYKTSDSALTILNKFETSIKKCEHRDSTKQSLELYKLDIPTFLNTDIDIVVQEWFNGHLDPDFYYAIENNRLFIHYITSKLEEVIQG